MDWFSLGCWEFRWQVLRYSKSSRPFLHLSRSPLFQRLCLVLDCFGESRQQPSCELDIDGRCLDATLIGPTHVGCYDLCEQFRVFDGELERHVNDGDGSGDFWHVLLSCVGRVEESYELVLLWIAVDARNYSQLRFPSGHLLVPGSANWLV